MRGTINFNYQMIGPSMVRPAPAFNVSLPGLEVQKHGHMDKLEWYIGDL